MGIGKSKAKAKSGFDESNPYKGVCMKYDPDKHHRRSIRLKEYDYSLAAWYFITILTKQRMEYFGKIDSFKMELNTCGNLAKDNLHNIPETNSNYILDENIIMPNHIHVIIGIMDDDDCKGLIHQTPEDTEETYIVAENLSMMTKGAKTLGYLIRQFKARCTRDIRSAGASDFAWHRNYYEKIIRSEKQLNAIRDYITANPYNWHKDPDNPELL